MNDTPAIMKTTFLFTQSAQKIDDTFFLNKVYLLTLIFLFFTLNNEKLFP